jgi:putative phosphonate metabolism protein
MDRVVPSLKILLPVRMACHKSAIYLARRAVPVHEKLMGATISRGRAKEDAMVEFPQPLEGPVDSGPRYAIYFAPAPETPLHALGSAWLGRDSIRDEALEQPPIQGLAPERLSTLTVNPRRYGFHATLKPPFHLKPGTDIDALLEATRGLARAHAPIDTELAPRHLSGFLALMQARSRTETRALAAAAVSELDRFRALPSEAELERRREAGLSAAQETLLQRWGYPYVMNEFRFHMTLSHRMPDDAESVMLREAAMAHFAPVIASHQAIDRLAVFREEAPGTPFTQVEQFALGTGA